MELFNKTTQKTVSRNITMCDTYFSRLKGLLGRKGLNGDEGICLKPCPQIHMFFMTFPIDVVFADKNLKTLNVTRAIKPWRISKYVSKAACAFELAAGFTDGAIAVGDQLELRR